MKDNNLSDQEVVSLMDKLRLMGMTYQQVANAIGVHSRSILRWLAGETQPRKAVKVRLRELVQGSYSLKPALPCLDPQLIRRNLTEEDIQFLQRMYNELESLSLELAFELLMYRKIKSPEDIKN